jgi:hypothetical protein
MSPFSPVGLFDLVYCRYDKWIIIFALIINGILA